jgi:predicted RNA-binding Zn-ribbon protein involved in translation (DUF1610 family)
MAGLGIWKLSLTAASCPNCGASSDPDSEKLRLLLEEYVCVQSHVQGLGEGGELRVGSEYQIDWEDHQEPRLFCPNCGQYWPSPQRVVRVVSANR